MINANIYMCIQKLVEKYDGYMGIDSTELSFFLPGSFNVLNRFDIENVPLTKITSTIREETYPVDPVASREAIINAIVHNDLLAKCRLYLKSFRIKFMVYRTL